MVSASFEHEGNSGLLRLTTHFGHEVEIVCEKLDDEKFKLGGTAVNAVVAYEGVVLRLPELGTLRPYMWDALVSFKAFRSEEIYFEGKGILSFEDWDPANRHCYVTEYYSLDMEGKPPGWFISQQPIRNANHLFVNLDVCDGGGNVVKRYRVSPFTGQHVIREGL